MTATNHVVFGALVATVVQNPVIAIPVALASHYALDALPHFDYPVKGHHSLRFFIWLAIDCGIAASILASILLLQPANAGLMIACGIAAASPDLMWLYYTIYKHGEDKDNWPLFVKWHAAVQRHTGPKLWPLELSWLAAMGGLLLVRAA
ncbi:MAG: hypothetical protein QG553_450 [Patescibacteria group bacterium]|nr:hypothetical protein [Patescibacteria group bacterium]